MQLATLSAHGALRTPQIVRPSPVDSLGTCRSYEAGEMVYEQNCAECHGEKLRSSGAVPDLRKMPADARAIFDETVKNGRGQMPSWEGQLTDENFDQIWAYIRSRAQ